MKLTLEEMKLLQQVFQFYEREQSASDEHLDAVLDLYEKLRDNLK